LLEDWLEVSIEIPWRRDIDAALQEAKQAGKLMNVASF